MTNAELPRLYLARHGETEWSRSGRHTGRTDLPLTAAGEREAALLATRVPQRAFAQVLTSPLQRARRTCEIAGFGPAAHIDLDLCEWDYGEYEGLRTEQILAQRPGWNLFRDGCPAGESPADVALRADRVVTRVRELDRDVLVFSSGHFLRVLAARWVGQPPGFGALLLLGTSSLSMLGYEHDRGEPVIRLWNDIAAGGS